MISRRRLLEKAGRRTVLWVFILLHSPARARNGWEGIQIFLSRGDQLCLRATSKFQATCEWFGPNWVVVRSPLAHVLRGPSCDDMCCLSIVSPRRDQLLTSGHACLQRRLCQQLHREEWKRRLLILGARAPPVKADKWADSQPNSEPTQRERQSATMCGPRDSSSQENSEPRRRFRGCWPVASR